MIHSTAPDICTARKAAGCEWFVVEQDFCEGDPFTAIQVSLEYLKGNGDR